MPGTRPIVRESNKSIMSPLYYAVVESLWHTSRLGFLNNRKIIEPFRTGTFPRVDLLSTVEIEPFFPLEQSASLGFC